jgi:hypothetical protein
MRVVAACARWRAGEVAGDEPGSALRRQAEEVLLASGVRNPAQFVEIYATGAPVTPPPAPPLLSPPRSPTAPP